MQQQQQQQSNTLGKRRESTRNMHARVIADVKRSQQQQGSASHRPLVHSLARRSFIVFEPIAVHQPSNPFTCFLYDD